MFVYSELTLHHLLGSDFDARDRIQRHAEFWNGIFAGLQAAGFMALGRMYDRDFNDRTIHALLKFAETIRVSGAARWTRRC